MFTTSKFIISGGDMWSPEDLIAELDELRMALAQLEKEKEEDIPKDSKLKCQKDLIKDQQKVISDLKDNLQKANDQAAKLGIENADLKREIEVLKSTAADLEFENNELQEELNDLNCGAKGDGCSELKALQEQIVSLKAENHRLQEELDNIAYSCEECDGCESHDAKILDKLARIEELAQKWSQK